MMDDGVFKDVNSTQDPKQIGLDGLTAKEGVGAEPKTRIVKGVTRPPLTVKVPVEVGVNTAQGWGLEKVFGTNKFG